MKIIIPATTFVAIFISMIFVSCQEESQTRTDIGTIVHKVEDGHEIWGMEVKRGIIFKRAEILLFSDVPEGALEEGTMNLPETFKQEGLKVKCTYVISDVIGTSNKWSTVIKIIDIELLD